MDTLQISNLKKVFSSNDIRVAAVNDVSFSIGQGEFASIVGRSGSGKTTLLSMLGGLERPSSGQIVVNGKDITKFNDHQLIKYRAQKVGFVFQAYNLVPNLTAIENVMLAMEAAKIPHRERKKLASTVLKQVGLKGDEMNRKPSRLSGGQQQRVAIARALANNPSVIFADEPTGNLDEHTGEVIFEVLRSLSRLKKTTIVIVTHDIGLAERTDKIFQLKDGKLGEE